MEARAQTIGEEIANSVSHGIALLAALGAAPVLIETTFRHGSIANKFGAAIFAATIVLLYCASCIYHAVPWQRVKAICRRLDHGAIFLLIAGTYTPFTLGVLKGPLGWSLFVVVWTLALIGVVLKAFDRLSHPIASLASYIVLGSLMVTAIGPLTERVPTQGLLLIAAGALAYVAGVGFFATDSRVRYGHFVWHLFVISGTACHFFAVLWYASAPIAA